MLLNISIEVLFSQIPCTKTTEPVIALACKLQYDVRGRWEDV